jgi:hypothetical protein
LSVKRTHTIRKYLQTTTLIKDLYPKFIFKKGEKASYSSTIKR